MTSPIEQPPVSGPGSGVAAWRDYAVSVTGEPAAEFDAMSRDEIIDYLDVDTDDVPDVDAGPEPSPPVNMNRAATFGDTEEETPAPAPETGSWMVPTKDGWEAE